MIKYKLFSLENCPKCDKTKELLSDRNNVEYFVLSKNMSNWSQIDQANVEAFNVFDDLRKTAPVLVVLPSEKHYIGYLSIKKALENFIGGD